MINDDIDTLMAKWTPPAKSVFYGTKSRLITKTLFIEHAFSMEYSLDQIWYTLKEHHYVYRGQKGEKFLPSLRVLFVEMEDPTEYDFANKYLASMVHWQAIKNQEWFQPEYQDWVEELNSRLKAKAFTKLKEKAADPYDKDHFQANKFIYQEGTKIIKNVGRPTNKKIKEEARRLSDIEKSIDNDYKRLLGNVGIELRN